MKLLDKTIVVKLAIGAILFWRLLSIAQAQDRTALEKQKKQLRLEIGMTQRLLSTARINAETSLNDLKLLQQQLDNRRQIVDNIQEQLYLIDSSIDYANFQIDSLQKKEEILRADYAALLRQQYIADNAYSKVLFLFSAESWNEAYRRFKYIQYYSDYRKKQYEYLQQTQNLLQERLATLHTERIDKQELLKGEEQEKQALETDYQRHDQMITKLRKKERLLSRNLHEQQSDMAQLDRQIMSIITAETERMRKSFELPSASPYAKTENIKLSANFAGNRGKLPWPVTEGVITGKFGTNPHPVLKNISTTNNGIDISTNEGAPVLAVFEGIVTAQFFNPSFQWAIIIKHGDFFTVYANLEEVEVKKGDRVTTRQPIGVVHTDTEEGKTAVHIEVWEGGQKLNPIYWLRRNP